MSNITTKAAQPPVQAEADPAQPQISIRRLLGIGLSTRLLVDTGTQIFFPFLPVIAAGLGVTPLVLGRLISLRSVMGLVAPLFGALADRFGYRRVMRLGLMLGAVGYALVGSSQGLALAALGMVLGGLGTFAFIPALQAYLSSRLPYARRARGLGILEYAWAFSGIVGLFLVGQLMEVVSWRLPFWIIGAGLLAAYFGFATLPPARLGVAATAAPTPTPAWGARLRGFFDLGANRASAWGAVAVGGLTMYAALHLFINYGSWLAQEYGLGPQQLGTVALLLGLADLGGSVLVSLVSDRLGKRRSVLLGSGFSLLFYLLLPVLNVGLPAALVGLLLVRFAFEVSIVSNMTLLSEQVAAQRAKVMTLGTAAALAGSTLSGFTGPWAYAHHGLWGLSLVSAAVTGLVLLTLVAKVREMA